MGVLRRLAMPAALAVAFAVHTLLVATLTGRVHAAAFVLALCAGATVIALVATGRPIAAMRTLDRSGLLLATAGGVLAVFAAPALVAANRLSDAPSGSVVVFWVGSGCAAVTAAWGSIGLLRAGRKAAFYGVLAGALAILVGGAAVLANWERPSSFSPLIKFPEQELAMVLAGAVLVTGIELLTAAGRRGRPLGAMLVGALVALACAIGWTGAAGVGTVAASFAEAPWTLSMAGIAWGLTLLALAAVWRDEGVPAAAACLALAPVLLSALTWLEQALGAAGPQPMIVTGVGAGCLVVLAGAVRLVTSGMSGAITVQRRPLLIVLATAAVVLAAVALVLPALRADVTHKREVGTAALHWFLPGAESIAVLATLAIALLVVAALLDARAVWPSVAALAACAAVPALADVPTHVIVRWLPPVIQQDYGTEYATVVFTRVASPAAAIALAASAAILLALIVRHLLAEKSRPASGAAGIEGS